MVEVGPVENIHEVGVEAGRVVNIRLVVYRIAQVIQVTGKISENEVEMIAWALTPFLDECRDFLVVDHCRGFLVGEVDDCKDFAPVEVEIKVVVSENSSLLMTRGVVALLMVDGAVLLVIAASPSLE